MRDFKIVLGTLPVAINLLVPRLAALRLTVALDLLPEMLISIYEKKTLVTDRPDIGSIPR